MLSQVYEPPFLFMEGRPVVTGSPAQARHGAVITLGVEGPVSEVVLMNPGSDTHGARCGCC